MRRYATPIDALRTSDNTPETPVYLVVIGWLYVVVMMAAVSDSILTALARLLFLGILPVVVLLWMGGLRRRRPRPAAEEPGANEAPPDQTR